MLVTFLLSKEPVKLTFEVMTLTILSRKNSELMGSKKVRKINENALGKKTHKYFNPNMIEVWARMGCLRPKWDRCKAKFQNYGSEFQ